MSKASRDLIVSLVAGAAIMVVFASIELVESLYELTREHEDWDLDEILASIPAFAIVAAWFAFRRWREVSRLNRTLDTQATELAEALAQRQAMEEQLREGYKIAAMGTFGGGFAGELKRVFEPIKKLARKGADQAEEADTDERNRLEQIADAANNGIAIVNQMLAFGDGGMRETETLVAAEAVREIIDLSRDKTDSLLKIDYRIDDETSRIRVNRWELHEVAVQLVANAVDAMGTGGQLEVSMDRTTVDEQSAIEQGIAAGDYVHIVVKDAGPGIPPELQSHVFEPFFTTKGAGDGKGLGLAIAYSLVRGWNGNLLLRPQVETGATFEILVPAHDA